MDKKELGAEQFADRQRSARDFVQHLPRVRGIRKVDIGEKLRSLAWWYDDVVSNTASMNLHQKITDLSELFHNAQTSPPVGFHTKLAEIAVLLTVVMAMQPEDRNGARTIPSSVLEHTEEHKDNPADISWWMNNFIPEWYRAMTNDVSQPFEWLQSFVDVDQSAPSSVANAAKRPAKRAKVSNSTEQRSPTPDQNKASTQKSPFQGYGDTVDYQQMSTMAKDDLQTSKNRVAELENQLEQSQAGLQTSKNRIAELENQLAASEAMNEARREGFDRLRAQHNDLLSHTVAHDSRKLVDILQPLMATCRESIGQIADKFAAHFDSIEEAANAVDNFHAAQNQNIAPGGAKSDDADGDINPDDADADIDPGDSNEPPASSNGKPTDNTPKQKKSRVNNI